jgi:glucosamine--fructose-6-phosphate aminotransferase (isomerizing)
MTYIEQEIQAQPDVLQDLLTDEADNIAAIASAIKAYNPRTIHIAARGTSDNAARYAQYLFGIRWNKVVSLATPSVHTLYGSAPDMTGALVVGISQSGASDDIRKVLEDAKAQGAMTLAITNKPESALADVADHTIHVRAGDEISVAATKTYTAQLAAIAMLFVELDGTDEDRALLADLPEWVGQTLEMATVGVPKWVERYRYMSQYAVIGRGYNYATAFEISLKVKELCYITGESYSEADFLHGPIALVEDGFPVVLVMPAGAAFERGMGLLRELQKRDAETLVISNRVEVESLATQVMRIAPDIPEWLSPIAAVIPGQVFAMNLASARSLSLDNPRGLKKVTITR